MIGSYPPIFWADGEIASLLRDAHGFGWTQAGAPPPGAREPPIPDEFAANHWQLCPNSYARRYALIMFDIVREHWSAPGWRNWQTRRT